MNYCLSRGFQWFQPRFTTLNPDEPCLPTKSQEQFIFRDEFLAAGKIWQARFIKVLSLVAPGIGSANREVVQA